MLLFTHEEEAYLCIIDHELDLLLAARGIERDGDGTDAPGTEVGKQIVNRVLREDSQVFLHANAHGKHGVGYLTNDARKLIPRARFPLLSTVILVDECLAVAIMCGHVVYQTGEMAVDLHNTPFY